MAHSVPVYDEFGDLKEMILVGSPPSGEGVKLVESYGGPFASADEAAAYAEYLGFTEVKIVKTKTKLEALAAARAARKP
jgi:hypothetical protein